MFKVAESGKRKTNEFGIGIRTPWENDRGTEKYNILSIDFFKRFWYIKIPQIIKPKKVWVEMSEPRHNYKTSK